MARKEIITFDEKTFHEYQKINRDLDNSIKKEIHKSYKKIKGPNDWVLRENLEKYLFYHDLGIMKIAITQLSQSKYATERLKTLLEIKECSPYITYEIKK